MYMCNHILDSQNWCFMYFSLADNVRYKNWRELCYMHTSNIFISSFAWCRWFKNIILRVISVSNYNLPLTNWCTKMYWTGETPTLYSRLSKKVCPMVCPYIEIWKYLINVTIILVLWIKLFLHMVLWVNQYLVAATSEIPFSSVFLTNAMPLCLKLIVADLKKVYTPSNSRH